LNYLDGHFAEIGRSEFGFAAQEAGL